MKTQFDQKALSTALKVVMPFIARSTMAFLEHIKVSVKDGKATLVTTDLGAEASTTVDCTGDDGEFCIAAARFKTAVENAIDKVTINTAKVRATVTSGSQKHVINLLPASDFPVMLSPAQLGNAVADVDDELLEEMIQRVIFTAGINDVRYYLNAVLLTRRQNTLWTVASNGYGLAACSRESEGPDFEILVPRMTMDHTLKLGFHSAKIFASAVRFVGDNGTVLAKMIDGKFPDFHRILQGSNQKNVITVDRMEMVNALRVVDTSLAMGKSRHVRMKSDGAELVLPSLRGRFFRPEGIQKRLTTLRDKAIKEEAYERAAVLRDIIRTKFPAKAEAVAA